jgi:hypothetical protein
VRQSGQHNVSAANMEHNEEAYLMPTAQKSFMGRVGILEWDYDSHKIMRLKLSVSDVCSQKGICTERNYLEKGPTGPQHGSQDSVGTSMKSDPHEVGSQSKDIRFKLSQNFEKQYKTNKNLNNLLVITILIISILFILSGRNISDFCVNISTNHTMARTSSIQKMQLLHTTGRIY